MNNYALSLIDRPRIPMAIHAHARVHARDRICRMRDLFADGFPSVSSRSIHREISSRSKRAVHLAPFHQSSHLLDFRRAGNPWRAFIAEHLRERTTRRRKADTATPCPPLHLSLSLSRLISRGKSRGCTRTRNLSVKDLPGLPPCRVLRTSLSRNGKRKRIPSKHETMITVNSSKRRPLVGFERSSGTRTLPGSFHEASRRAWILALSPLRFRAAELPFEFPQRASSRSQRADAHFHQQDAISNAWSVGQGHCG